MAIVVIYKTAINFSIEKFLPDVLFRIFLPAAYLNSLNQLKNSIIFKQNQPL
jgi:hypothetical protein